MRGILAVVLFIAALATFLIARYSSDSAKEIEKPIPTCGVSSYKYSFSQPVIFKIKCATCHQREKNGTGPALIGIEKRQPYNNWFREFVTNQDSLEKVNEPYTDSIIKKSIVKFKHNFKNLESNHIDELLEYFKRK